MARYIQRIALLGKERWIGWEIDGVGTEVAGLTLADGMSDDEIRARGIKEFRPMPFESFLGMGATIGSSPVVTQQLLDEDVAFRLDALLVGLERYRSRGLTDVPRAVLTAFFGEAVDDPRIRARLDEWQRAGAVEVVGAEECYLRICGRLA